MTDIAGILAPQTGYCHTLIRRMQDAGKETSEAKEARVKKILEADRKKVLPIYNAQGEIIEYNRWGRHLDVFA